MVRKVNGLRWTAAVMALVAGPGGLAAAPAGQAGQAAARRQGSPWLAYVTHSSSGTVSVLDTVTDGVVDTFPVGKLPAGVAISPDAATAYVANSGSGTVSVLDTATRTLTATVDVGANPVAAAVCPDGSAVYVANHDDGTVSVLDTATRAVLATVPVGPGASGIAFTPDGATAYVASAGSGTVAVLDTVTRSVTATLAAGGGAAWVAVSPDGAAAYVTNSAADTVSVLDTAAGAVTAHVPVGDAPSGVTFTPDGAKAYVTNLGAGTVSVLDTAARAVTATVPVELLPVAVAVTPDQGPVARLKITPGRAGGATTLHASALPLRYGRVASYRWDFGDGKSALTRRPVVRHVYTRRGAYTVRVTLTSSGGTSTAQVTGGQTLYRNGGRLAAISAAFTVPAAPPPRGRLSVDAAADRTAARVGARVGYRIAIANTGRGRLRDAAVTGHLAGVLDNARLRGPVRATAGTVRLRGQRLRWTGDLAPGARAVVTFAVVARTRGLLRHVVTWKGGRDRTLTRIS